MATQHIHQKLAAADSLKKHAHIADPMITDSTRNSNFWTHSPQAIGASWI